MTLPIGSAPARAQAARAGLGEARRILKATVTEKDFLQQVRDMAHLFGWRSYHSLVSRGSEPGFPDLCLCRPPRLLMVELKTSRGRVRPEQEEWLADLNACGIEAAIWRPDDLASIEQTLRPA